MSHPPQSSLFKEKMALLCRAYYAIDPHLFDDWTDTEVMSYFMTILPRDAQFTVNFAFSADAIRLVLDEEMTIMLSDEGQPHIAFAKQYLDEDSWLLANGINGSEAMVLSLDEEDQLNRMIYGLKRVLDQWQVEVQYGAHHTHSVCMTDIKSFLMMFAKRFKPEAPLESLHMLHEELGIWRFFNLMMVHAMNKKDAAYYIFGEKSSYYQLWQGKQSDLFRLLKQLHRSTSTLNKRLFVTNQHLPIAINY